MTNWEPQDNVIPILGREPRADQGGTQMASKAAPRHGVPGEAPSRPESPDEIGDAILERMNVTERELELAWARLRRTLRGG